MFFFAGSILEQANGLRVKRGEEVVDKRYKVNSESEAPEVARALGAFVLKEQGGTRQVFKKRAPGTDQSHLRSLCILSEGEALLGGSTLVSPGVIEGSAEVERTPALIL